MPTLLRRARLHGTALGDSLVITGGRIAWIGPADQAPDIDALAAAVGGEATTLDADGALVTPAFVDAHVHSTATGIALGGLDLTTCRTLGEVLDRLADHCRRSPGRHVIGHGWQESTWPEQRPPTREEIDRASGGAVVYHTRIDLHAALASSALIESMPQIRGMDGYDDSGWLRRDAHHAARAAALDTITHGQRLDAQRLTRARAASLGIAAFHELGGPEISSEADFTGILALAVNEPGPEIVGYWGELGGVERARELGALGAAGDLFADGAIGSHTACLRTVYADEDHTGAAYLTASQVRDHVIACTQAGLQAGFHVIGDGAMDAVIAGFREAAVVTGDDAMRACRHRLEHVEMIDDDQLVTMARLGIIASVQPVFDALWGGAEGMYVDRLGRDRAEGMNPFAAMLATGVPLAFGSDSPVTPLDPWGTVRAAVLHRTPTSRIGTADAFAAHTVGAWRAAGVDDRGRLEVGAKADLVVWDVPEFPDLASSGPDGGWRAPSARRTYAAGHLIHDDGSL